MSCGCVSLCTLITVNMLGAFVLQLEWGSSRPPRSLFLFVLVQVAGWCMRFQLDRELQRIVAIHHNTDDFWYLFVASCLLVQHYLFLGSSTCGG